MTTLANQTTAVPTISGVGVLVVALSVVAVALVYGELLARDAVRRALTARERRPAHRAAGRQPCRRDENGRPREGAACHSPDT